MATTLPPTTPQEEDERYNVANDLYEAEFNAGGSKTTGKDAYANSGIDQLESFANDPQNASSIKDRENNPMGYEKPSGKESNSPLADLRSNSPSIKRILRLGKNFGPGGIIVGIITAVLGLLGASTPLLPLHVAANALNTYDSNKTSFTIRTDKMIVNKLTDRATSGVCTNVINIACRYQRPSGYMLKNMEQNGVTALDKKGNKIENRLLWANKRPASYTFKNLDGSTSDPISAKNLKSVLNANAGYRSAFHSALKTRLQTFSDSIFKSVAAKFGFTKKDVLAETKSEKDLTEKLKAEASGTEVKTDASGKPISKNKDEISKDIQNEGNKEVGKISKSGSLVGLVAGAVCLVSDGPGIVTRTARAYQMAQLVRFGAMFLTVTSAMKAGDATPTEVETLGKSLTAVYLGMSAMDSFGMKFTLFGDTSAAKGSHFRNYVPGGSASQTFGPLAAIFDSPAKKNLCAGATSPITGVAIDAALAPETLGIGTLINVAGGVLGGLAINAVVSSALPVMLSLIPSGTFDELGKLAFGDLMSTLYMRDPATAASVGGNPVSQFGAAATASAVTSQADRMGGQNYGDALMSGVANMLGQLSNAGGNSPMSIADAVAYDQLTNKVNVAYAQEDQATLSPFDASNKNTFMGSIVEQLLPLYGNMGSLTSTLSSISGVASSTAQSLLLGKTYAATDPAAKYNICQDPSLTTVDGQKVAAGPFCNIQYGIPPQYLNLDPQKVVEDMVATGQIDDQTGEAKDQDGFSQITGQVANILGVSDGTTITSYKDWLSTCGDGTSEQAFNCEIKDKITAEYALYTIDHRIQKNIDNEDTTPTVAADTSSSPTTAIPTTCTNTKASGTGYVDYNTLPGIDFESKVNAASGNTVALDGTIYSFSNFASQQSGSVVRAARGLSGINPSSTVLQVAPNSSTIGGQIPPQSSAPATNQFYILRMTGVGPTLNCLTIKGTSQGHLYNGVMYQRNSDPTLSNTVVSGIPGDASTPPGETFMVNFFGNTGTATITNNTIDGNNVAAAGLGMNSSSATFNITNLSTTNMKYSAGIALWNQTGTVNIHNWTSTNSARELGAEHLAATVNLYDPNWDNPTNGHDITLTPYPGNPDGRINIYLTKVPSRKFVILTNTNTDKPWVHVYMNGTEQPQNNFVTWQGA